MKETPLDDLNKLSVEYDEDKFQDQMGALAYSEITDIEIGRFLFNVNKDKNLKKQIESKICLNPQFQKRVEACQQIIDDNSLNTFESYEQFIDMKSKTRWDRIHNKIKNTR